MVSTGTKQHSLARESLHRLKPNRYCLEMPLDMGCHLIKTTIEIADDLFERAQHVARKEQTTFRSLTEQGLRIVLKEKQAKPAKWKWKPVTFRGGGGLTDEFMNASWEKFRDEIYRGHGA
jgi:thioesterase domain-containing protein